MLSRSNDTPKQTFIYMYKYKYIMVKTTTCIIIDHELLTQFKAKENNVSKAISKLIEQSLNIKNSVVSTTDKQLLDIELETTKKQFTEISLKLSELENIKQKIDEDIKQQEIIKLQQQKEIENNAIKCIKCQELTFENRRIKMRDGFMCRACFSTMTRDDIKIYS